MFLRTTTTILFILCMAIMTFGQTSGQETRKAKKAYANVSEMAEGKSNDQKTRSSENTIKHKRKQPSINFERKVSYKYRPKPTVDGIEGLILTQKKVLAKIEYIKSLPETEQRKAKMERMQQLVSNLDKKIAESNPIQNK